MSASPLPALDAIAFQLMATLDTYDADVTRMLASWPDLESYREVSAQVERIRLYSASLPAVRVQWVELLIAHAELVHFLWRMQYGDQGAAREELGAVSEHHLDCVAALRNRCRRTMLSGRPRQ